MKKKNGYVLQEEDQLAVYEGRLHSARRVKEDYNTRRREILARLDWEQRRLASLEKEFYEADKIIEDYTQKIQKQKIVLLRVKMQSSGALGGGGRIAETPQQKKTRLLRELEVLNNQLEELGL